jgi:hypothetical protein
MAIVFTGKGIRSLSSNYAASKTESNTELFAKKVGLIGKLFGCGHGELSRPFSQGKIGYRSCLKCGAVKQFNPETLETFGGFYYPSIVKENRV